VNILNHKILKRVVDKVSDQIAGDWLIIGGTVLPLVGIDYRVTVDVDLVSFLGADNQSLLDLMNIASELKLPVETINQAGAFFLQKIPRWQEKVVLVQAGKKGRVFRPNLHLFFELKLKRLSETDLQDCIEYFKWCKENKEQDKDVIALVKRELEKEDSREKENRLKKLLKAIT
jgi:hypothetical protein